MCQQTNEERAKMLEKIAGIHATEGFDPSVFAEDIPDAESGKTCKRLPDAILISMFRMKYPDGKIAVSVKSTEKSCVATARVYPHYKDAETEFLAEATVEREPTQDKESVSVMESAQTAAIGDALRNAGFGLQYAFASGYIGNPSHGEPDATDQEIPENKGSAAESTKEIPEPEKVEEPEPPHELTLEEKYKLALRAPCPINKYKGKTLGELLGMDQKALSWVATKFTGDEKIKQAAITICEYAKSKMAA